jgi:phosphohistidine phosphatase
MLLKLFRQYIRFYKNRNRTTPMKTIYLIRHATAEDGSHSLMFKDYDRNLTSRGIIEAARMGKHLASLSTQPIDYMISSKALRAAETSKLIAEQLPFEVDNIVFDETIYGGGPRAYLTILNQLDETNTSVAIVGHNPDVTFFAEYLTRDDIGGSMETAGVVILNCHSNTWQELTNKCCSVIAFMNPSTIS